MMTKNQINKREQLVPPNHLVPKLDAALESTLMLKPLYSTFGRPSIETVVLFKMTMIQYVFDIRSLRQTIKEIETNVAFIQNVKRQLNVSLPMQKKSMVCLGQP